MTDNAPLASAMIMHSDRSVDWVPLAPCLNGRATHRLGAIDERSQVQ